MDTVSDLQQSKQLISTACINKACAYMYIKYKIRIDLYKKCSVRVMVYIETVAICITLIVNYRKCITGA